MAVAQPVVVAVVTEKQGRRNKEERRVKRIKKAKIRRAPSRSLMALSATALALPGIATADSPPTQSTVSYKYSNYQEDDVSRREAPFGERERYEIDVNQFRLLMPTGRNTSFQLDAIRESMSGASPWFTTADSAGNPLVNLSGASGIRDQRSEVALTGSYYLENGTVSANVGYSEEDDYRSRYIGLSGQRNFNREMTTVAVGLSYADDDIFPTDAELFNRVVSENKDVSSAYISISQIINQTTIFQTALSITEQSGYLSDPYKLLDVRPDDKTQIGWSNAFRHFFIDADAALHVNYRYYHDDFGISSHTLDASWYQNVGRDWQVVPHIRYYSQSAADFYTSIDDFTKPIEQFQSSDYRLSAFGAISGGINLIGRFNDWTLTLSTDRYIANEKYSAYNVNEPGAGLVSFFRVSLGIDYSF